jgi:hypothetical protein
MRPTLQQSFESRICGGVVIEGTGPRPLPLRKNDTAARLSLPIEISLTRCSRQMPIGSRSWCMYNCTCMCIFVLLFFLSISFVIFPPSYGDKSEMQTVINILSIYFIQFALPQIFKLTWYKNLVSKNIYDNEYLLKTVKWYQFLPSYYFYYLISPSMRESFRACVDDVNNSCDRSRTEFTHLTDKI